MCYWCVCLSVNVFLSVSMRERKMFSTVAHTAKIVVISVLLVCVSVSPREENMFLMVAHTTKIVFVSVLLVCVSVCE